MNKQDSERNLIEQILRLLCPEGASNPAGPADSGQDQAARALIQFMEEMPGGFLIYRAGGDEEILFANRSLLRIFQCASMEEFREHTGNSFRGLVYPGDLEAVEGSIKAQLAASRYDLDYVEYRICRRDGAVRWIEDYGHFIHTRTAGDVFYVFLGDATDKRSRLLSEHTRLINEQLEQDRKLRQLIQEHDEERSLISQEYMRQMEVIEGLSVNYESICFVDLDVDQVVPFRLSRRTSVLFYEYLPDRSYSRYAQSYVKLWVHPEDRDMVTKTTSPRYIREKLADNRTYYLNYRVVVDGEIQYLQLRVVSVRYGPGLCQAVLGYRRVDEEIQQQMEQQALLAEALAKANEAVNSKNAFLSNMSHDMRTPLNAIFGFTSLAKLCLNNPTQAAGYLERVETASRQLLDLIDKVLQVSARSDSAGTEEVEYDLREVVQKVFDFLQPQAQEKDLEFILDCSNLRCSAVRGDPEKLRQLTLYLANNAVTYTNPGGRVTIAVEDAAELPNGYGIYRLSVKDTGIGISQEFLDRIFEPFSREKNTTLSGIHGVGLGLTIAKNIVDMLGGTLEAQSTVNVGSTFTAILTLRLQPKAGAPQRTILAAGEIARRILLVEDNEINREIEEELLGRMGFTVDPAEDGQAALEKVKRAAPGDYDLVLMDIQMPVMDGWETSKAIRALPDPALAELPIIALSANVLDSDWQRSKESGIDAHLLKPMDLSVLLRTIEEVTGKHGPPEAEEEISL